MYDRLITETLSGLSEGLGDERLLKRFGELARELTGARDALLSWEEEGQLRHVALGPEAALLEWPRTGPSRGRDLLGLLEQERRVVRIDDVAAHPAVAGLFPERPPIRQLLVAPLEHAGELLGALSLADRQDGGPFDEEDEQTLRMVAAICAMALVNARRFRQLRQAREELEQRVAERTRELEEAARTLRNREIELELLNEELLRNDESRSRFVANTSHELRTPLNAIIGFSELLAMTAAERLDERQRQYLRHISTSGRQLLELVNHLLDLARIESGMMEIEEEIARPGEVLDEVITQLGPLAGKKEQELLVQAPEQEPALRLDAAKLRQVWTNLIGNAIKYVPEGGRIEVGYEIAPGQAGEAILKGRVRDNGPGLEPEEAARIFEPFQRAGEGRAREEGGAGLGLALVRQLLEIQGGSIEVESQPGEFTCFRFTLPVRLVGAAEAAAGESMRGAGPPAAGTAELEVVEEEPPERLERPPVLVIDDCRERAAAVVSMLEAEGYEGLPCPLEEAGRLAQEKAPFVIMVGLPPVAVEVYPRLRRLRGDPATRNIPLVLLGGDAASPRFTLGTVDAVEKGLDRNHLLDIISRHSRHLPRPAVTSVLVIDDDPRVRDYVREVLHGHGFRILLAASGREGLQAAIEREPDLVLLDLMMPEMSGFEVVEALKRHPTARDIPVVIFTAKELTREEVMRLGQEVEKVLAKGSAGRLELLQELRSLELLYPVHARLFDRQLRCFNPRYLMRRLDQECSRGERYGQRFSLVGWELEGYDAYTARHGQRWGEVALREMVEMVRSISRRGDVLIRSGEAEFALLLPAIDAGTALRVAEKLRLRLRMRRFPLPGGEAGRFTAAFGCAHYPADGRTPQELGRALQRRIAQAQEAGGDRTVGPGGEGR